MTEWCVDASVAVKWAVKDEPSREKALAFLSDAGTRGIKLIAPPLFISELSQKVRKPIVIRFCKTS